MNLKGGVDWFFWRLLTHDRLSVTLTDLETMSLDEALDAHFVLDAFDEVQ